MKMRNFLLMISFCFLFGMFPVKAEAESTVTFSLEASTIGMGYVIEPVTVKFNKGESVSHILDRVLTEKGFSYDSTGRLGQSGFYLSAIGDGGELTNGCLTKGAQINAPVDVNGKVPAILQKELDERNITLSESYYETNENGNVSVLGEFCYTSQSGWMYRVNNVRPGIGMGAYIPKDGDVIRFEYTLAGYGGDLGGESAFYPVADKDAAVKKLAEFNGNPDKALLLKDETVKASYDNLIKEATNLAATAEEIKAAIADLDAAVENFGKNPNPNPDPETPDPQPEPEKEATVTFSLEASTIGMGYIIEPVTVKFNKGESVSHILDRVLTENGFSYDNIGRLGQSGFYLSAIGDGGNFENGCLTKGVKINAPMDINGKVPAILQKILDDRNITLTESVYGPDENGNAYALGEFCYTAQSGWMYRVNNVRPDIGMGSYIPKDGDVIRFEYTLAGYGGDLGGGEAAFYPVADKDAAVKKLAEFNGNPDKALLLKDETVKASYDNLIKEATNLAATAEEIKAAIANLDAVIADLSGNLAAADKVSREIEEAVKNVTLASKPAIEAARASYEKLTSEQKKLINETLVAKLAAAEEKIVALEKAEAEWEAIDKAAAAKVTADIEMAVKNVTLESKEAIMAARKSYDALTLKQKDYVDRDIYKKLVLAENEIKRLEAEGESDRLKAEKVVKEIEAATKEITLESKEAIMAARKSYNSLTPAQKALISPAVVKKLTEAEKTVEELTVKANAKLSADYIAGNKSIKLTWKQIPGAEGYDIFRYDTKSRKYRLIARTSAGSFSYLVKREDGSRGVKLGEGKSYTFVIRSYEVINGKKVYTKAEKLITVTRPEKTVLTSVRKAGPKKVKLSWKKIKGVSGYQIYMKTGKRGSYRLLKDLRKSKSVRYTRSGFRKNQIYSFRVRTYKVAGRKKVYSSFSKTKTLKFR